VTPFSRFRSHINYREIKSAQLNHLATLAVSTIHSDCHFTMQTGESMQRVKLVARMPCPHTLCFNRCSGVF